MKYLEDVKKAEEFSVNGITLTEEEYEIQVKERFSDPITRNEIHRLINECAYLAAIKTPTTEETAAERGGIRFGVRLLNLKDGKKDRVTLT